jgi:hypothetical protein
MKITTERLKEVIKEEVAINESVALAARVGMGFLQLMGSSTGRKMIAGVLRGIGAIMKFSRGANKWALEKVGLESPDFVRELEASIEAGPGELANFIEGMNDEEALKLGEIAAMAENPPSAIEAPPLQEAKFRKITKSQLKEIIKEELNELGGVAGGLGAVAGRVGQEADSPDHSLSGPKQIAEDSLVGLLVDLNLALEQWEEKEYPSDETRYQSYFQDIQKLVEDYDPCVHVGQKCGEAHPNQSHEECIEVTINDGLQEEKAKDNPWAICTASVGREDKEKYEKCVMDVKKEKGIK